MARPSVTQFLRAFEDVGRIFADMETDLFILLDEEGCIEWVNPAWERKTGYTEREVLRVPFIRYVDVDDYARFIRGFTSAHPEPFRILHREGGVIGVRIEGYRFKRRNPLRSDENESVEDMIKRQAYLILRPIKA